MGRMAEVYRDIQEKRNVKRKRLNSQVHRALWTLHLSGNEEALADRVREQIHRENPTLKPPSKRAVDNALNDRKAVDSRPRSPHPLDRRAVTIFRLK